MLTDPVKPLLCVEDVTPEFVTGLLRGYEPSATVAALHVTKLAQGSTTHIHLDVTYADAATPLPNRLFLKTQLQTVGDLPEETAAGLAEGGAAACMLRDETRFYRDIRPELSIETPTIYFADLVPRCQFIILCEDLGARHARIVRPDGGLSLDDMHGLLRIMAQLHAKFWDSPRLAQGGDLDWIDHPVTGMMAGFLLSDANEASMIHQLNQPYKAEIFASLDADREELRRQFSVLQQEMATGPITLAHGDAHVGNAYFLPDGTVGLLDWQMIRKASWAHDVGYAIVNALDTDARRAFERELLAYYRNELLAAGVSSPPDEHEMWRLYSLTPVWGLRLYGVTPAEMYSETIIDTQLRKFAAAYTDLDTGKRLSA